MVKNRNIINQQKGQLDGIKGLAILLISCSILIIIHYLLMDTASLLTPILSCIIIAIAVTLLFLSPKSNSLTFLEDLETLRTYLRLSLEQKDTNLLDDIPAAIKTPQLLDSVNAIINDVTQHLESINTIPDEEAKSEALLALALDGANDGLWRYNPSNDDLFLSDRYFQILSLEKPSVSKLDTWMNRVHPEDKPKIKEALTSLINGEKVSMEVVHRIRHRNHYYSWVIVRGISTMDDNGQCRLIGGSFTDITAMREAEGRLNEEKQRLLITMNALNDAVISTDENGFVQAMNPRAEALTGWTTREARGKPIKDVFTIVSELSRDSIKTPVERTLEHGQNVGLASHTLVSRAGRDLLIEDTAVPIRDSQKQLIGAVLVFRDVSGARQLTRQISYQATHDDLTGLFNRSEFERRLKIALITAKRGAISHCMLYIDIDLFKIINDTCGHMAGDQLLREISPLIEREVPASDIIARLGGDEFGILLNECAVERAIEIADRIRQSIESKGFNWRGQNFVQTASFGVVEINNSTEDVSSILKHADSACFASKDSGRNRVHIYRDDDQDMVNRHGEMQWVSKLNDALEQNKFILYQQSIVPLSDKSNDEKQHYEILLRLTDENGNLVPPFIFLSAAERYNMIDKIDRWVIRNTFKWLNRHPGHVEKLSICSINLSGKSMCDPALFDFINEQFDEFDIPCEKICFEVTETMAVANIDVASILIRSLRDKGCKFALDDFGTGMASFGYLKTLPVDYLKIDGSFVKDMISDPIDAAMVNSINEIGHVMEKQTIAEFVEDDDIRDKLKIIGVDFAQGYGVAYPAPLDNLA